MPQRWRDNSTRMSKGKHNFYISAVLLRNVRRKKERLRCGLLIRSGGEVKTTNNSRQKKKRDPVRSLLWPQVELPEADVLVLVTTALPRKPSLTLLHTSIQCAGLNFSQLFCKSRRNTSIYPFWVRAGLFSVRLRLMLNDEGLFFMIAQV